MKTRTYVFFLILFSIFQSCKAQHLETYQPKIEGYTKGELEIKVVPFGLENPITVGNITTDGVIYFNWPELDLNKIDNSDLFATPVKQLIGGSFCKDPDKTISDPDAKVVQAKNLFLYKYGKQVGSIIPSTQKGQEHNKEQIGSTIHWVYNNTQVNASANCTKKIAWEDMYSFNETTTYDFEFKKGWNIVSYNLTEIEAWQNGTEKGSLPKTIVLQSLDKIPSQLNWHLKYWANDELLEIEQALLTKTPITKQQYENWLPKTIGDLKRTGSEIGEKLERIPSESNINLIFEKESQKINLTLVDCAGNEQAINIYTLTVDMASRDWKDKTDTGYKSASKLDETRVLTDFNEKAVKTILSYTTNGRFLVKAEGVNFRPEDLWQLLKSLNYETLIQ